MAHDTNALAGSSKEMCPRIAEESIREALCRPLAHRPVEERPAEHAAQVMLAERAQGDGVLPRPARAGDVHVPLDAVVVQPTAALVTVPVKMGALEASGEPGAAGADADVLDVPLLPELLPLPAG